MPEDIKDPAAPAVPDPKPADVTTPEPFEIERNGEKVTIDDAAEQRRLAQMGYDYTQKTQALAEDKKSYQSQVEKRALEIYNEALERQKTADNPPQDDPEAKNEKRLADMESRFKSMETEDKQKVVDAQFASMVKECRGKHTELDDMDEKLVVFQFTQELNDSADPKQLLDAIATRAIAAKKAREQEVIKSFVESKTKNPFASGETGKGSSGNIDLNQAPKTMEDAKARAYARLEAL